MEIYQLQTIALSSRGAELLHRTRQTQQQRSLVYIAMFPAAVMVGFPAQRELWCHSHSKIRFERPGHPCIHVYLLFFLHHALSSPADPHELFSIR